jgi:serine/threonine-protein kinase
VSQILRQLGRYELVRRIAVGGMGEIYLARMKGPAGFEKRVIIKTILPHLAEEPEFVEKFLDEGNIVVQLTHGNIVPVFDMGRDGDDYYIAMEYLPGRDLREIVRRLKLDAAKLPIELALMIIIEVCKGLSYAHRKSDDAGRPLELVHRDVSPSNILVSREGDVRIIDFGIARATSRSQRTSSGQIQGKFCYMSPEQANAKLVDARSDIFSTAVVLYELLCGQRPFDGANDLDTLERVRQAEHEPVRSLRPEVSPELDAIVSRALSRDPAERYQSIDRLQVELTQQLYASGAMPTGQDLAAFLNALFPEGLEREELRGSASPAAPRMSLEDALDFELGRLGASTTPSGRSLDTSTLGAMTRTATQHEPALVVATTSPSALRTPPTREQPKPAEAELPPSTAQEQERPDEASATPEPAPPAPEPAAPAPSHEDIQLKNVQELKELQKIPSGTKRLIAAVVGLTLLALLVGAVLSERFAGRGVGRLRVESEPPDARIFVDGERLRDVLSPAIIELAQGEHEITLRLDGYAPASERVVVRRGGPERNQTLSMRLEAQRVVEPPEQSVDLGGASVAAARRFTIESEPSGAQVFAYTEQAARGVTPLVLEVQPGEVIPLKLRREGCEESSSVSLSASQPDDRVMVELECDGEPSGAPDAKRPTPKRYVSLSFASEPPSAKLWINGRQVSQGYSAKFAPDINLQLRAEAPGYEPAQIESRASAIKGPKVLIKLNKVEQGCVDVRILPPSKAELSFNGGPWVGANFALKGHKLPAGEHKLIARNREAQLKQELSFRVAPGASCAKLQVFDQATPAP